MSRRIPVQEVRNGCTLVEAVHDRSGRLLVPAGTTLQPRHLRVLLSWGVASVCVEDVGDEVPALDSGAPDAEDTTPGAITIDMEKRADEILGERFHHCDTTTHPMDGIYHLARRALLDEMRRYGGGTRSGA